MAEIAVLREHIVGYAKTRDTYVDYRTAGYSKKFLAEHERDVYKRQVIGNSESFYKDSSIAKFWGWVHLRTVKIKTSYLVPKC